MKKIVVLFAVVSALLLGSCKSSCPKFSIDLTSMIK